MFIWSQPSSVEFSTLIVTALTVLIGIALALIAFFLNRDFRKHMLEVQAQNAFISGFQVQYSQILEKLEANSERDRLEMSIFRDVLGNQIAAEKISDFIKTLKARDPALVRATQERQLFQENVARRMRELNYLLAVNKDKRAQLLSEIVAETPDFASLDFLSATLDLSSDPEERTRLSEALTVSRYVMKTGV